MCAVAYVWMMVNMWCKQYVSASVDERALLIDLSNCLTTNVIRNTRAPNDRDGNGVIACRHTVY